MWRLSSCFAGRQKPLLNGSASEPPGIVPADGNLQDSAGSGALQQRLTAAEQERDKAKKQLNRQGICKFYSRCILWAVMMSVMQADAACKRHLGSDTVRMHCNCASNVQSV